MDQSTFVVARHSVLFINPLFFDVNLNSFNFLFTRHRILNSPQITLQRKHILSFLLLIRFISFCLYLLARPVYVIMLRAIVSAAGSHGRHAIVRHFSSEAVKTRTNVIDYADRPRNNTFIHNDNSAVLPTRRRRI